MKPMSQFVVINGCLYLEGGTYPKWDYAFGYHLFLKKLGGRT